MKHFFKYLLILSCVIALACSQQSKAPTGKATLTGKSSSFPIEKTFNIKVSVPNLVEESKQIDEYEAQLEADGSFSLSIPLFSPVYALLSVNGEDLDALLLSPDKETKIELSLNEKNEIQIKTIIGERLTQENIEKIGNLNMIFFQKAFYDTENGLKSLRYDMTPKEYKDYILTWTEQQISTIVDGDKDLPKNLKQMVHSQLKWFIYIGQLFSYEGQIDFLYKAQHAEKKPDDAIFTPQKPDKSYYSFLSFFDWDNPPLFNTPSYPHIFQNILIDSILNIPDIKNQSLTDWLKEVKTIMNPLIGSDTGSFYDMLTLHAYKNQIDEDQVVLSHQQIEDIKAYFKNPTFAKYLFTENEEMIKQTQFPSVIKETPAVEKEKLMEAIISQYKGKVVVVDFWATWCAPCLDAMQKFKKIKEEFRDKDIVYIYITDSSSPVDLWKKKLNGISGEHYYLSREENKYICDYFQIDAIPSYLIYDSAGTLKYKTVGFPGIDEMKKAISESGFGPI